MQNVYIGLGSNLHDPHAQVESGLRALAALPGSRLVQHSRVYDTVPWGRADQPAFANAVAQIETALAPRELLDALLAIERAAGRERDGTRWGPRMLDLDILVYGDRRIDEPGLRVPHPHLHERAFVLVPLCEIAPDLEIPGHGRAVDLLAGVDAASCVARGADARVAK
ncbi:MAG: 2-amino-4-hydroxy-6-hydroxymethyldihydropteridine diphosphokinase [Proteobacteria bacterium]|nr:2-amino-4-hydroxy-6-hydroxymethyldihydropteridine diphosphokinase [Pseudomonadota bacterium]